MDKDKKRATQNHLAEYGLAEEAMVSANSGRSSKDIAKSVKLNKPHVDYDNMSSMGFQAGRRKALKRAKLGETGGSFAGGGFVRKRR